MAEKQETALQGLETEKMVILENMSDIAREKEESEVLMLEKFTLLMNEKKKKIMALQLELDQYKDIPRPSLTFFETKF